ncbi:MAG: tetratricopeptide repeat protein [Candidatus Edwardsbacteria bacterium]|nr:tetratricopeptide repeat protein [Candidatus Edwardsbacteria bacterium]MBU1576722.1 tetratricopeptide repeat protein [Candidatus Edwardsbacteria bacterium]MBU2464506.1 tetratricopeptide repeat protein [Candidatus Edwardsbacteria bacterium]MBU2594811.1 tetratricopeptide repeat protein [Candidatus Edwardsbacteria bacterium]
MKIKLNLLIVPAICLAIFAAQGQKPQRFDQSTWQKAVVHLREGNREAALEQFKISLGGKPDQEMTRQAGRILQQSEATNQAEAIYLWGRKALKEKNLFAYELGELFQQQLKYREAAREFARALKQQPGRAMGKFEELSLQAGYKAVAVLAENEVDAETDDGRWLLGELFRKSGDYQRAWHYHKKIKDGKRLRMAVGQLAAQPGPDITIAISVIAEYLEGERVDRIYWEIKLSELYLTKGDHQKAEKMLISLSDKKIPQAQLDLAGLWLRHKNEPRQAMALIDNQKKYWPDSLKIEGDFTVCLCLMALSDWERAGDKCAGLAEGMHQPKIKQRGYYLLGEIKLARNQPDEALKYYGQAARADQEGAYANDALARILLISQSKTDKISDVELLGRAMAFKYQGDQVRAGKTFAQLADSGSGTMAGDLALTELAEMDFVQGSFNQAIDRLKRLAENTSDTITAANAYYRMGRIYFHQIKQKKAALECWRLGIIKYPNTSWAEMMRQEMESGQAQ